GDLLKRRKSERTFSDKPIPLKLIANVLGSCKITDNDPERRTYPSAGARFPIEIYIVAFRVKGLEPGIYHFNSRKFSLETILLSDLKKFETEFVSPFLKNPAGAVVLTSVMSRSEVKYGLKAYPYSLIEAGHMGQNILLSCIKNKVGSCPVGGFVNDRIIELFDLTEDEVPLYVIGFGFKA
ncbi:MAG: SagB/ThcOx family dehydrogenase, partial [Candidatus Micrarchaeota archaeon]|nr:SagB/ThcOx family dehydrogenase [Candidatus Micrarchaeota archaeon]